MKPVYLIAVCLGLLLTGCSSEPSLQKYFVEKTESKDFIAVDISPTILNLDKKKFTAEENKAIETFKKMNILAFKLNKDNAAQFASERDKVTEILKDEKYQELMRMGSGKEGGSVSFVGDDEHIQEFVLFANKKENGFVVVRILGEDMNPTSIMTLMSAMQKSNINTEQLKPLQELFAK